MSKKYIMQKYEVFITESEIIADSEEQAKDKYERGEYKITNEYYLDMTPNNETWGELEITEEETKKLH